MWHHCPLFVPRRRRHSSPSFTRAHRQALELTTPRLIDVPIVTTDEVLAEFRTLFATAHEQMRRKALANAQRILESPGLRVVLQSRDSFLSGMALYGADPPTRLSTNVKTLRRYARKRSSDTCYCSTPSIRLVCPERVKFRDISVTPKRV